MPIRPRGARVQINDRTGTMTLSDSTLRDNPSLGFETYPGIFFLGAKASFVNGTTVK